MKFVMQKYVKLIASIDNLSSLLLSKVANDAWNWKKGFLSQMNTAVAVEGIVIETEASLPL